MHRRSRQPSKPPTRARFAIREAVASATADQTPPSRRSRRAGRRKLAWRDGRRVRQLVRLFVRLLVRHARFGGQVLLDGLVVFFFEVVEPSGICDQRADGFTPFGCTVLGSVDARALLSPTGAECKVGGGSGKVVRPRYAYFRSEFCRRWNFARRSPLLKLRSSNVQRSALVVWTPVAGR